MLNLSNLQTIQMVADASGTHWSSVGGTAGMMNFPDTLGVGGATVILKRRVKLEEICGGVAPCLGGRTICQARRKEIKC